MEISRHLIEALGKESLEVKTQFRPGKIGVDQLQSNVASFKLVVETLLCKHLCFCVIVFIIQVFHPI